MAITITYTFTPNTTALSAEVNANFSLLASRATDKTGDTLTGTLSTQVLSPSTTNTYDLGTSSLFYRTEYLKTSLVLGQTTANYTLTWANPAAARAISFEDPLGTDIIAYKAATQTFTNKTLTSPTINSATLTGTLTGGTFSSSTISSPTLGGTVVGTYTLGGTPTIPASGLTGTITAATQDLITRLGTITSGVWNAGALTTSSSVALTGATNNLGTITTGTWNAGAITSSGNITLPATSQLFLDGGGDTSLQEVSANTVRFVVGGAQLWQLDSTGVHLSSTGNITDGIATPTIASGFGTSPAIAGKSYGFMVTVGTGGTATTGTVNFGTTYTNAPIVTASMQGGDAAGVAVQSSTTQVTISSFTGAAWVAGIKIYVLVRGY